MLFGIVQSWKQVAHYNSINSAPMSAECVCVCMHAHVLHPVFTDVASPWTSNIGSYWNWRSREEPCIIHQYYIQPKGLNAPMAVISKSPLITIVFILLYMCCYLCSFLDLANSIFPMKHVFVSSKLCDIIIVILNDDNKCKIVLILCVLIVSHFRERLGLWPVLGLLFFSKGIRLFSLQVLTQRKTNVHSKLNPVLAWFASF